LFKGFSFPKNELSAVPPDQYANRFVKFIRNNVKSKEELPPKEELSHVPIPEESPMPTPSGEGIKSPISDDIEVIRTVVSPPDHPNQKLPAIRIQHPSPDLRDRVFEKEMVNGIKKPLTNGWNGDYFGEEVGEVYSEKETEETVKEV
jgi:hypothetical protein